MVVNNQNMQQKYNLNKLSGLNNNLSLSIIHKKYKIAVIKGHIYIVVIYTTGSKTHE
jgi:hypothetical protein